MSVCKLWPAGWVLAALLITSGCNSALTHDLAEPEANEIIVALAAAGITADKEPEPGGEGRYAVEVPSSELALALATLEAEGLPRPASAGLAEAFAEGGLVPTATEEKAKLLAALGDELSRTIEALDGVIRARVHVALPELRDRLLDELPPAPRASVLVEHRADRRPPDEAAIRALVGGAIEGLAPEDIAIHAFARAARPTTAPRFARVGPFTVAPGSARFLEATLAFSLLLHVVSSCLLLVMVRRRRARGENEPLEGE